MKNVVQIAALTSFLLSLGANARVIYGEDHRTEVSEANPLHQKLARSTATMISLGNMIPDAFVKGAYYLDPTSLKASMEMVWASQMEEEKVVSKGLKDLLSGENTPDPKKITFCKDERFIEQVNVGSCSGFLIAPDLLITAGHCVEVEDFCDKHKWVFDYAVDPVTHLSPSRMTSETIYSCKKVISYDETLPLNLDYALVQLDRKVTDREPLTIREEGKIEDFTSLVVIGNPLGLPTKVAAGAHVRENGHPFFFNANIDSYHGNSGAAVFDAKTGLVEGILVRGDEDFVGNPKDRCIQSKRCTDDGCRGEDVSRLSSMPEVAYREALNEASLWGDLETIDLILETKSWVDFNLKDGVTALMKAAQGNQIEAMKRLLLKGADIDHRDAEGNTVLHHVVKNLSPETVDILSLIPDEQFFALNNDGKSVIDFAIQSQNQFAAEILLRN